jgi:phosphohistidine phosphatase SixA
MFQEKGATMKKRDRKLERILLSNLPITQEELSPVFDDIDLDELMTAWNILPESKIEQVLRSIARLLRTFG